MPLRFRCPGCGTVHKVDHGLAGAKFCCPSCARVVRLAPLAPSEIRFEKVADKHWPAAGAADAGAGGSSRRRRRGLRPGVKATTGILLLALFSVASVALVAAFDRVDYRPPNLVGRWTGSGWNVHNLTIEFRADGTAFYDGETKKIGVRRRSSGPWEIVGRKGTALRVRMGNAEQTYIANVVIEDADTFTFTREEGDQLDPLLFTRAKEEPRESVPMR